MRGLLLSLVLCTTPVFAQDLPCDKYPELCEPVDQSWREESMERYRKFLESLEKRYPSNRSYLYDPEGKEPPCMNNSCINLDAEIYGQEHY